MFDRNLFHAKATQLWMLADGYATLGLDAGTAARWANRGFTPGEAAARIARGVDDPDEAARIAHLPCPVAYRKTCTCC